MNNDWENLLQETGALWHHDGNLLRPFVRLTSGAISADFADMSFAMAKPRIIAIAARELASKLRSKHGDCSNMIMCGQMKGSVTLASRIAEELDCGFIFTDKIGEGVEKQMLVDGRFDGIHPDDSLIVMVEDVASTALTSHISGENAKKFGFPNICDDLLTIVDRTGGTNKYGFNILSCFVPQGFTTWPEGENPFIEDGDEKLEPVRAKTKAGRRAIHQVL